MVTLHVALPLLAALVSSAAPPLHGKHVLLPPDTSSQEQQPIEVVYEHPSSSGSGSGIEDTPAVGIMLIGHGCNHRALDSWPPGKDCPGCVGLPVETNIVAASLDRGWVVVAVSAVSAKRTRFSTL